MSEGVIPAQGSIVAPPVGAWRIPLAARGDRVWLLIAMVMLLGLADLDLTLVYARSIGMAEGNPVARAVMGLNSPAAVVAFKLATMLVAFWIILRYRGTRYAETGAWIMLGVMAWLMVQWCLYVQGMPELTSLLAQMNAVPDPRWVVMAN